MGFEPEEAPLEEPAATSDGAATEGHAAGRALPHDFDPAILGVDGGAAADPRSRWLSTEGGGAYGYSALGPSAAGRAEAMELFREVNEEPGRGAPPSAAGRAEAMDLFREANEAPGRGAPPSAAGRAEAMDLFREMNDE
ncbi:MAG: hypothetical protein ACTHU0_26520 [Kofleriaceae bacterium]